MIPSTIENRPSSAASVTTRSQPPSNHGSPKIGAKEGAPPPMTFDVTAAIAAHKALRHAKAKSLGLPEKTSSLAHAMKTVYLKDGTRVQTPRNDLQGLLMMDEKVPDRDALRNIRIKTLVATASLLSNTPVDAAPNYLKQVNEIAHHFAEASGVPLHQKYHDGSYVGNPMDFMPVVSVKDGVGTIDLGVLFKFLEHNSLGWSGTHKMPDIMLDMMKSTIQKAARDLAKAHGNLTTIVITSSGRENPEKPVNSFTMQEKILWGDWASKAIEEELGGEDKCRVVGFEPKTFESSVVNQPGWTEEPKATVIVGYTSEVAASKGSDIQDGWMRMFSRNLSAMENDRGAATFQTKHAERTTAADKKAVPEHIDTSKTMVQNPFVKLGTDKGVAYDLFNEIEQILNGKFPRLAGQINYKGNLHTEDAVFKTIKDFIAPGGDPSKGRPVALKPSETGHSHGIQYIFPHDDDATIRDKMSKSIAEVQEKYDGFKGFPYTVMDYYEALKISAPVRSVMNYADGCKMELRVGVVADHRGDVPMLRGMPYVVRINLGGKTPPQAAGEVGAAPKRSMTETAGRSANASDQRKAGWRDDQVAQPLINMEQARMFFPAEMSDEAVWNALTELTCGSVKIVEHAHWNHDRYAG